MEAICWDARLFAETMRLEDSQSTASLNVLLAILAAGGASTLCAGAMAWRAMPSPWELHDPEGARHIAAIDRRKPFERCEHQGKQAGGLGAMLPGAALPLLALLASTAGAAYNPGDLAPGARATVQRTRGEAGRESLPSRAAGRSHG